MILNGNRLFPVQLSFVLCEGFVLFDWGPFPYLLSVERSGVTGQLFKVNISLPYVLQEYIAIYTSLLVEYRSSSGVRPVSDVYLYVCACVSARVCERER